VNLSDLLAPASPEAQRINGVVVGIVTNNSDDKHPGCVRLTFPWLNDSDESNWARLCSFMAGPDRGALFLPEVGDEVLVAFEHGDPRFPYVLGALWNGKDKPPQGNNDVRVIKSRSGSVIRLTDAHGAEKIEITDKDGNAITIDSAADKITLSAPNGTIRLEAMKIEIEAKTTATLKGPAAVNIN
jgi:uncharacterized protein involved in type VI secretion and phage assembly